MTTASTPDPSDDYGYDLAHEVQDALKVPVPRRRRPTTAMGTGRPADPDDNDLGYADAHDASEARGAGAS